MHRVHQGVYLFGTGVMLPGARELAAVLAYGEGTRLGGRSALGMLGVIPPWPGDVEVVVVGRYARSRAGIRASRMRQLAEVDRSTKNGIPIVSPALALVQFARVAVDDELERAIAEAYALKLVSEPMLRAVVERMPKVAGTGKLRAELDREGGPQWTSSKADQVMKSLLRQAHLPMPVTRERVAGWPADFFWPAHRLIVEVDGFQFHGSRWAFERDRRRDQAHIAAGYTVIRFTWRQLNEEPLRVIATIAMALGAMRAAA